MNQSRPRQFSCSSCAGKLEFAPGTSSLKCPHCGHLEAIPESDVDISERDFAQALRHQAAGADTEVVATVHCDSCGATTDKPQDLVAFECVFCGSPIVTQPADSVRIRPASLLPFAINRDVAIEGFRSWIAGLWFAPNNLKQRARIDGQVNGVYLPHWTYDSHTTTHYRGQRGEYYTTTETYTQDGETRTRQVTKTRWYDAAGVVYNSFDDVLVSASRSLPQSVSRSLEPWDLHALVPYSDEFLPGFLCESYQIDIEAGFEHAKDAMAPEIEAAIRRDIGGDVQRISTSESSYHDVSFKHILLPLWIATYRYNDEPFRFLVNARTGEVQGSRPISWIKVTLAALAAAGVAAAAYYYLN